MTELPAVTAVILAGGRSRRFGADKLAVSLDGRPLLEHVVAAVAPLATEVVVAAGTDGPSAVVDALRGRGGSPVRVVADPLPDAGPAAGLRAALEVAREPTVLVVAGDTPRLAAPVLELLVRHLAAADPGAVDSVALALRGRVQPLPVTLRVGAATAAAQAAAASGDARLLGILAHLRVRVLEESAWRPLDPEAWTLVDVDRPADLDRVRRGD